MEQKRLFNETGERGTSSLIGGNSTNIREWNRIKYNWAHSLYRLMLNNFWIPEEISLNQDVSQFPTLTVAERRAFDKVISFLNFLDSIQCENLPHVADYITAPEVTSLLNIQTFQEEIHAQSYSYILDTVCSLEARNAIYDEWRNDPILFERNKFIADEYQKFVDEPTEVNFVHTLMADYLLEAIYFYNGFAFFYSLARNGKMTMTATLIKYIHRDEETHVALFSNMIHELKKERPDLFDENMMTYLENMMKKAVEHEINWGKHFAQNKLLGLTDEVIERYIRYLSNQRMRSLGLRELYPEVKEHPMKWVESFKRINETKTDFFEQKVTSYTKSSGLDFSDL